MEEILVIETHTLGALEILVNPDTATATIKKNGKNGIQDDMFITVSPEEANFILKILSMCVHQAIQIQGWPNG